MIDIEKYYFTNMQSAQCHNIIVYKHNKAMFTRYTHRDKTWLSV